MISVNNLLWTLPKSCPFHQLSSASGRGRRGPAVWPSPWKDPAGRRSPSTTTKTDRAACRTSLRSPVEKTHTALLTAMIVCCCLPLGLHCRPLVSRRLRDLGEVQRRAHTRQPVPGAGGGSSQRRALPHCYRPSGEA